MASCVDDCSCDSCLAGEKGVASGVLDDPLFVIHVARVARIQTKRLMTNAVM